MGIIRTSNWRLWVAIALVRIAGKKPEVMAEVYDALSDRRNIRGLKLTAQQRFDFERQYLSENAPDLLKHLRIEAL